MREARPAEPAALPPDQPTSPLRREPCPEHDMFPAPNTGIVKRCSCNRPYTEAEWRALPFVGYQAGEADRLALRNCPCGSTIAIVQAVAGSALTERNP